MLDLKSLTKSFGGVTAVDPVSLSVPDGAFLVLLGPSGSGKTTLVRMIVGLGLPSSGQIVFDGRTVSDGDRAWAVDLAQRNSVLVFQSYALWLDMTVRGNVDWPLRAWAWTPRASGRGWTRYWRCWGSHGFPSAMRTRLRAVSSSGSRSRGPSR
jgi:ABC-type Fe3+/spermidine/putrescine transport system ATPase subunit